MRNVVCLLMILVSLIGAGCNRPAEKKAPAVETNKDQPKVTLPPGTIVPQ